MIHVTFKNKKMIVKVLSFKIGSLATNVGVAPATLGSKPKSNPKIQNLDPIQNFAF